MSALWFPLAFAGWVVLSALTGLVVGRLIEWGGW